MYRAALCVLAVGCGRVGFDAGELRGGPGVDGAVDAETCVLGPWSAPVRLDTLASSTGEWAPGLSPDGLSLVFSSLRMGGASDDLYIATRGSTAESFGAVQRLSISSTESDSGAAFSADGRVLYFDSVRSGALRLWRATRSSATGIFETPELVPGLEQARGEGPTVSSDGAELLYSDGPRVMRARRGGDGRFTVTGPVDEVLATDEGFPSLSGDDLTVYFESTRSGVNEFWSATRPTRDLPFSTPTRVGDASCGGNVTDAEISRDGRTLLYACDLQDDYDLYAITRACQ